MSGNVCVVVLSLPLLDNYARDCSEHERCGAYNLAMFNTNASPSYYTPYCLYYLSRDRIGECF